MRLQRAASELSELPVTRFVMPVSGVRVMLRQPTGIEDLLLSDHRRDDPAVVLRLVERLGQADIEVDWGGFPVTDIDTLILRLRQFVLGNVLSSSLTCAARDCGSRVEISFGIDSYLAHHRPHKGALVRRSWGVAVPEQDGWYRLTGDDHSTTTFRLPTLRDQIAVAGLSDGPELLAQRCIRSDERSARISARIDAAMSAYAPPLAGPLLGRCPDCGTEITARFEAREYCLQEFASRARFVYDDIDTLAERYHWSERAILAMPQARRVRYVERALQMRQT
jgi:hypothetical protein